jgi:hypothetical protein
MKAKRLEEDEDKGLEKAEATGMVVGCGKDGMDRFTRSYDSWMRIPLGRSGRWGYE